VSQGRRANGQFAAVGEQPVIAAMPAANGDDAAVVLPAANGKGKIKLLTRDALDGRSKARRDFDTIHQRILSDISGGQPERVSTIDSYYAEAAAMLGLQINDFNTRRMLGQKVDLLEVCQTITTFVRVASRLPHGRIARDVTPTLGSILRNGINQQLDQHREADHAD
jgi:hypothetical protein